MSLDKMTTSTHNFFGLDTAAKSRTQQILQPVLRLRHFCAGITFEGRVDLFMKRRPNGGKPHPNSKDKAGMIFGSLTVISRVIPSENHSYKWLCRCECGKEVEISSRNLSEKLRVRSCGCSKNEHVSELFTTHGDSGSREYNTWHGVIQRCENPNSEAYPHYGGRGITVCSQWRNSYEQFLKDMGRCPNGLTLDRINNDGNYEPDNCRWATRKIQNRNRRDNQRFTVNGITGCISELSEHFGIAQNTAWHRIQKAGWSVEDAFLLPVKKKGYTWYGRP